MSCGRILLSYVCSKEQSVREFFLTIIWSTDCWVTSAVETLENSAWFLFNYLNFLWRWLSRRTLLFVPSFHKVGQFIPGPTAHLHSRVSLLEDTPPAGKPMRTQSISIPILGKNATQDKGSLRQSPDSLVLNSLLFCSLRHQQLLVICREAGLLRSHSLITFQSKIEKRWSSIRLKQ